MLRPLVVPRGPEEQERTTEVAAVSACETEAVQARPRPIRWARLLKRVLAATSLEYQLVFAEACAFDIDIDRQHCPNCGARDLKIMAAILERPVVEKILTHRGLDPQPRRRDRAREVEQD